MLYSCWRFGGEHPAVRWRSNHPEAVAPPEPWPARVDAFMVACAIHAGQRERDLVETVEGIQQAAEQVKRRGAGKGPRRRR